MPDFILDNLFSVTIYLVLGTWWIIWVAYRDMKAINLDKFFLIIFFGHFVLALVASTLYLLVGLLRDLTPTRLKSWLFEEWK